MKKSQLVQLIKESLNESNKDTIAQKQFKMNYSQLGKNEKEWVDDEIDNIEYKKNKKKVNENYKDVEESTLKIKDRDKGDSLSNLSTQLSQTLYDDLSNKDTPDNPALIISKWGVKLKQATDLDDNQISDLTKDALALRGTNQGSRYKQVIRDKIYRSLKGDKIG